MCNVSIKIPELNEQSTRFCLKMYTFWCVFLALTPRPYQYVCVQMYFRWCVLPIVKTDSIENAHRSFSCQKRTDLKTLSSDVWKRNPYRISVDDKNAHWCGPKTMKTPIIFIENGHLRKLFTNWKLSKKQFNRISKDVSKRSPTVFGWQWKELCEGESNFSVDGRRDAYLA